MEKTKFEFQKLELPQQVLIQNEPISTDNNNQRQEKSTRKTINGIGYFFLTALICTTAGYKLHEVMKPLVDNKALQPPQKALAVKPKQDSIYVPKVTQKPVYFNYFDSIIFLNQVKGPKKVVSKGFDEYIKKKKLIVKAGDYYYNLFCDDLINSYSVGDSIP